MIRSDCLLLLLRKAHANFPDPLDRNPRLLVPCHRRSTAALPLEPTAGAVLEQSRRGQSAPERLAAGPSSVAIRTDLALMERRRFYCENYRRPASSEGPAAIGDLPTTSRVPVCTSSLNLNWTTPRLPRKSGEIRCLATVLGQYWRTVLDTQQYWTPTSWTPSICTPTLHERQGCCAWWQPIAGASALPRARCSARGGWPGCGRIAATARWYVRSVAHSAPRNEATDGCPDSSLAEHGRGAGIWLAC